MSFWVAGAVVGSAVIGGMSAKSAAGTQADAANASTAAQERMFERQVELQEPWRLKGEEALNRLAAGLKVGGEFDQQFGIKDFTADPGYAFRLSEGMKALDRTAAARGGLLSGSTLKGAQRYGQDLASQEYQNAFNRYQINRANRLQPLQSLAGVGQSAANTLTSAAGTLGQNIGSNIIGAGNAAAAGTVGVANAISSGVGQGINYYQGQQYLNKLPNYSSLYPTYGGYTGGTDYLGTGVSTSGFGIQP